MTRLRAASEAEVAPGEPGRGGTALAAWSVVLGALFPVYLLGAVFVMIGVGLTDESGELLVTGWPAVPRLLLVLLLVVPLLLGMWLGVLACRRGITRTRRVAIWLNGVGLFAALFFTFLAPLEDAFMEGPTPGFSVRASLIALVIAGLMLSAALRAAMARD
jgi:hypothetical protein